MTLMRTSFAIASLALMAACTQDTNGQKAAGIPLRTTSDSVSYGFGAQIGESMRRSRMDSLNVEVMALGIREGLDSTRRLSDAQLESAMNTYKLDAQRKILAEKQAEGESNLRAGEAFLTENGKRKGVITTPTGLQYEVLTMGTGAKPVATDVIRANYEGTLLDGTPFDGTTGKGPATFLIEGVDRGVIEGWKEALLMMPVGSKWKLYVPAGLAYGASTGPGGNLPPQSTLIFVVELLDILPAQPGQ